MMEIKFWHKKRNEYEDYFTHDLYVDERGDVYCDVGYGVNDLERQDEYEPHIYINGERVA